MFFYVLMSRFERKCLGPRLGIQRFMGAQDIICSHYPAGMETHDVVETQVRDHADRAGARGIDEHEGQDGIGALAAADMEQMRIAILPEQPRFNGVAPRIAKRTARHDAQSLIPQVGLVVFNHNIHQIQYNTLHAARFDSRAMALSSTPTMPSDRTSELPP